MNIRKMPFKKLALALLVGSLTFWLPIYLLSVVRGVEGWIPFLIPLTFGLPLLLCFALEIFCDLQQAARPLMGLFMLLGVWVSGPFWTMLVLTLVPGNGFHEHGALFDLTWLTLIFPASTFMMSTYGGGLFALLLATVAVSIFAATNVRFFRWKQALK